MDRPPNPSHSPYEYSTLTGIPTISLEPDPMLPTGDPVNAAAAQLLPEQVCRYFRMIPVSYEDGMLTLAMADPSDAMAQNVAYALTNDAVQIVLAPPDQIDRAIDRVWGGLGHFEPFEGQMDEEMALQIAAEEESGSVAAPGRLGDILIQRGLITEEELRIALERQEQTGSRLGEILYYEMRLSEEDLAAALADQLRVPLVDLDGVEPDPAALDVNPEALQRQGRCVPLAIDDSALYIAITDPLDDETYEAIRELTDLRIRTYMVTRSDLEALLRDIHLEEHVRAARTELLTRFPEDCANRVLSTGQRIFFIAFLVAVVIGFVLAPLLTAVILVLICVIIYGLASLYKFKLFYDSFGRRREFDFTPEEVAAVDDRELPRYTILVPLFREAAVVPRLTENLTRLDYPKSKLEIMLLCEEGTTRRSRRSSTPTCLPTSGS
jgi:predicted LPLAT superfamily acyltransferase